MGIISNIDSELHVEIKIQGEFDIKTCNSFKEEIIQLLNDDKKDISIELSEMDFIDSPGIGILLSTYITLNKNGGNLILKNPQMHIMDLFEATQVTKYLKIESND